ncbi:hypothetical protein V1511DRAFT_492578 [Dipodascopsis uninucleata]
MTITNTMLDALAEYTTISVDTMWPEGALAIKPEKYFENATSNQFHVWFMLNKDPSLMPEAIETAKKFGYSPEKREDFVQRVINYASAILGRNMLKIIKGRCLSQTNVVYAYDTQKTIECAEGYIKAYEDLGVSRDNVMIKLPATYQALKAAEVLKGKNIKCLGTMVHSLPQAIASAEVGCAAISTYVDELDANLDPSLLKEYEDLEDNYGWALSRDVHYYYRAYGIKTRNITAAMIGLDSTVGLAGVDEMTIPLPCMQKLASTPAPSNFQRRMPAVVSVEDAPPKESYMLDQVKFEKAISDNKIATARISDAMETFVKYDGLTRQMINDVLGA